MRGKKGAAKSEALARRNDFHRQEYHVFENARLSGQNIELGRVALRTRDQGTIVLREVERKGQVDQEAHREDRSSSNPAPEHERLFHENANRAFWGFRAF